MIADIHHHGVLLTVRILQGPEQLADVCVQPHHAVVVICGLLAQFRVVDPHVGNGINIFTGQRLGRKIVDLPDKRSVGIREIYLKIKGFFDFPKKSFRMFCVSGHAPAIEVCLGNGLEIKWECVPGIDVQFANDASLITFLLQGLDDVLCFVRIHGVLPGRQPNLSVLVRVKTCQKSRARLGTPGLRCIGISEKSPFLCQLIKMRGIDRRAVASHLRAVIFRDDEQNIEWCRISRD